MEDIKKDNCDVKMPMIGDKAPEFKAITTNGKIDFPSDYAGKWVVLFSHPADFTPVCTTEFVALSRMEEEFDRLNVKLIGLSIDSLHSQLGSPLTHEELDARLNSNDDSCEVLEWYLTFKNM